MFNSSDMQRLGAAVRRTEKVRSLAGPQDIRRGMLGGHGGGPLYVHVLKDGGTMGGEGSTVSATYTVTTLTGASLPDGSNTTANHKSPLWIRASWSLPNVLYAVPGSTDPCLAMYDQSSPPNLILLYVTEKPSASDCVLSEDPPSSSGA